MFEEKIMDNVRKIMKEKSLTQATMAKYLGTSESQFSKILNGKVHLSLLQLENLARNLDIREIDIVTYPMRYPDLSSSDSEPLDAVLQIKLKKEKRDQVLKLLFGESNIEILNKI